jgi:hypothetical protein
MSLDYPVTFALEDGTHVEVKRMDNDAYDFTLTPKEGQASHFTLLDDGRTRDEKTESLDFDQLNAVRAFWLKQHDVI